MSRPGDRARRGRLLAAAGAGAAVALALGTALWVDLGAGSRAAPLDGAAPPFALPVVAGPGAVEGDRIALEGLRGRVVLLDFWATWCTPCAELAPRLAALEASLAGDGLTVVGVHGDPAADVAAIREAHDRFGAAHPSVEGSLALLEAYGVRGFPTLVLVDRAGRVAARWDGLPEPGEVERSVRRALGAPVPDDG